MLRSTDNDEHRANGGFTMIEALVALVVIVVALTAIGSVVATNARGSVAVDQRLSLLETARAILAGLPDRGQLTLGNSSGELAGNRWRIDVLPFTADFMEPNVPTPWVPRALVLRVQSPTGEILRLDTVRLQRVQGNQK